MPPVILFPCAEKSSKTSFETIPRGIIIPPPDTIRFETIRQPVTIPLMDIMHFINMGAFTEAARREAFDWDPFEKYKN